VSPGRRTGRARGFAYPIPIPVRSAYVELAVDPAATESEVRWALSEKRRQLGLEKAKHQMLLNETLDKVPGLRQAEQRVSERRQQESSPAAAALLAEAERDLAHLERKALQENAKFLDSRTECERLDKELHGWNKLSLDRPDERLKYDQRTPPLSLLKLRDCGRAAFTERRAGLSLIRRDVATFLEARGEVVFHPTDVTRNDFRGDFHWNELLDGPERP